MPRALGYAGVVASDTLYVIGGYDGTCEQNCAYQYSPTINEWLTWEGPNRIRYSLGAAMTDSGIYAIGGRNAVSSLYDVEFATVNSINYYNEYLHLGDDRINITGNYCRTYTDMSYTAPGFSIEFSRTYNQKMPEYQTILSALGDIWFPGQNRF
jgi:hypothetical protein